MASTGAFEDVTGKNMEHAYVTLATNDSYALGALVLGKI